MTKVLVVDDSESMARLLAHHVKEAGHEPLVARSGSQALSIARSERPDAILLDVMMPEMDGIEVLRHLKEDDDLRLIPVILVTAKHTDEDVVAGLDAGAHDYVTKPFKSLVLVARLRSAIRVKQIQDAIARANEELRTEVDRRKRMETELAQAQKLESVGRLAAGIAHEINTPIQYIGDNARFLREALGDLDRVFWRHRSLAGGGQE